MAVYEILEEIATEKKLSIADIARICNLPDSTVRGIIRRKQETIALEVAFKISNGLGVSLEKLNGMPEKPCPVPSIKKAPLYSSEAMKLAEDYDKLLDLWGKKQVRAVTDNEIVRCQAEAATKAAPPPEENKVVRFRVPGYSLPMSAGPGEEAGQEYPEDYTLVKAPYSPPF